MRLSRALALTHKITSTTNPLEELGALLDPELVSSALETAGVATLRKRRLPLEAMLSWGCRWSAALSKWSSLPSL